MRPKFSQLTFLIVISLRVIAAKPIQLPISIISGSTRWEHPFKTVTPSMTNKLEPIPIMLAPIRTIILHNCCK